MDKPDLDRHNADVIANFRANGGEVGGMYQDLTLLLLHTTGARTRQLRVNPLVCQLLDDGSFAVFAAAGGAPRDPDWYRNLRAHPDIHIEVGERTLAARARVATGSERDRIWQHQTELHPNFAEFPATAHREIPVVVLQPRRA